MQSSNHSVRQKKMSARRFLFVTQPHTRTASTREGRKYDKAKQPAHNQPAQACAIPKNAHVSRASDSFVRDQCSAALSKPRSTPPGGSYPKKTRPRRSQNRNVKEVRLSANMHASVRGSNSPWHRNQRQAAGTANGLARDVQLLKAFLPMWQSSNGSSNNGNTYTSDSNKKKKRHLQGGENIVPKAALVLSVRAAYPHASLSKGFPALSYTRPSPAL